MNIHALNGKYYIGYVLGTDYVGYCVTDEDYNILIYNKRRMIGTRLIDRVETAEKRRNYRTGRRRLARRARRIDLLQGLFTAEISKVDGKFFQKLNANGFKPEDRDIKVKYSLFNDCNYTDAQFYREYPTIYHLRKELTEKRSGDIRKLYLALHHIIKYRGNFLFNGDFGDCADIDVALKILNKAIIEYNETVYDSADWDKSTTFGEIHYAEGKSKADFINVLRGKGSVKILQDALSEILTIGGGTSEHLIAGMLGGKIILSRLFGASRSRIKSFSFGENYEDAVAPELQNELEESEKCVIDALKGVYNTIMLIRMLDGADNLSDAMIKIYDRHRQDLRSLKRFLRRYGNAAEYSEMFGEPKNRNNPKKSDCNYTHYIGGGRYEGRKKIDNGRFGDTCTHSEFCAYVLKTVDEIAKDKNLSEDGDYQYIKLGLKNADFMPKIVSKNNSLLPYQLNLHELKRILAVAEDRFEFLKSRDEYGSMSDKILKLMEFNIPYYVGPVSDLHKDKGGTAWVKRKSYGRVTPWNFEEQVDLSASEKEFITRMTNKCAYLPDAPALAKNSPVYSEYTVLNQLNRLNINGNPISVKDKQKIYDTVYKRVKAVTPKHIIDYYHAEYQSGGQITVTGYFKTLKGSLSPYITLKSIIGTKVDTYPLMTEKIVFLLTLHSDNRRAIDDIRREFVTEKGYLTESEPAKLKGLDYSGWGNVSLEFLRGSLSDEKGLRLKDRNDGVEKDVLDIMYETNMVLNEIVNSDRFDYAEKRRKRFIDGGVNSDKSIYGNVDALDCLVTLKHVIRQTMRLTKELVKLMGNVPPEKIFIEDNRSASDIEKTNSSRKETVRLLYQEAKKEAKKHGNADFYRLIASMESDPIYTGDDNLLRSDKNYLYLLQLGRCVYTGEKIVISRGAYDIDHIIPQCVKRDESLDNRALTRKDLNAKKADKYPLPVECRGTEARKLWDNLHTLKLMSDDKYSRLIRENELSDDELTMYVRYQLVETTRAAVLLKDLCGRWFEHKFIGREKPEIVFNKLSNVNDFKKDYALTHSRIIGDYHHALDAYYNIIVGNVLLEKFRFYHGGKNNDAVNSGDYKLSNVRTAFRKPVYSIKSKRYVWQTNTIEAVRKASESTDYRVSARVKEGKGQLYNETVYKPKQGVTYPRKEKCPYNLKQNGVYKYGGYKGSGTAYFIIADSDGKKGRMRTIEAVAIFYADKIREGKMSLEEFLEQASGLKNPVIARLKGMQSPVIRINSLIKYDGVLLRIRGAGGNAVTFLNAMQLYAEPGINRYVRELSAISDKCTRFYKGEESAYRMLAEENIRRKGCCNPHGDIVVPTKEDNLRLYGFIQDKLHGIYGRIPGRASLIRTIEDAREIFKEKSMAEQINILLRLLCAFDTSSAYVDTSGLAGTFTDKDGELCRIKVSAHQGKIQANKNITGNNVTLIHQSLSGLVENEVIINKVRRSNPELSE